MSVRLVDPDTGEEVVEPGRPGELRIKGPMVFPGYLRGDRVADPFDELGYLRTGDVFEIAGERGEFLRYVDRAKDLIIRGGMNIAPAELEGLIAAHPAVQDVAVVGYPDDVLGERVCAVVVPREGSALTLGELVGHLRADRIASYKLPERLELRDTLPRNPSARSSNAASGARWRTHRKRPGRGSVRRGRRREAVGGTGHGRGVERPGLGARGRAVRAGRRAAQRDAGAPARAREAIGERLAVLADGLERLTLHVRALGVIDGRVFLERLDVFDVRGITGRFRSSEC
ncbi:fatty acid--CoA ligase family protein [Streptosporangium vulgare]|uniref:class I adenylate-forming enzyme family protein n=1 Tax=Streptosporangium vulgare TaxID=46190 RepID=UPI0031E32322